jgi:hypothetical protein
MLNFSAPREPVKGARVYVKNSFSELANCFFILIFTLIESTIFTDEGIFHGANLPRQ